MEHRADTQTNRDPDDRLKETWPLRRSDLGLLVLFYVAMTLVWTGIGMLIKHVGEDRALGETDRDVAQWLVDRRTPSRDTLSLIGSMLSETAVKVVVTSIVGIVLLWVLRRWVDTLVIAVSLIIEAMIFITVTMIVARPRPDVPRLDESPVSTSFPSGHVAAAACYGAMAVVLFWHTRRFWLRAIAVLLTVVIPIVVAVARMYRGMHYLTDVVGGAILGVLCVVGATWILRRAEERRLNEMSGRHPVDHADGDRSVVATV